MVGLADSSGMTQRERSGKRKKAKSTGSLHVIFSYWPVLPSNCAYQKMDFGWILFKY